MMYCYNLLVKPMCPVLFVNPYKLNAKDRLCIKVLLDVFAEQSRSV
jgi:hypothetical protein